MKTISMLTKSYLKQSFKTIGLNVQVHEDHLECGDKKYKVGEGNVFPTFTNEILEKMPLEDLHELALLHGFNRDRFYPTNVEGLLLYYGWDADNYKVDNQRAELKCRNVLKRHVYCSPENHRPNIYLVNDGRQIEIGEILKMATMFKELHMDDIASKTINKLFS